MTPEATLLLAWLDEADAPQWVVDGVADALPKIEAAAGSAEAAMGTVLAMFGKDDEVTFMVHVDPDPGSPDRWRIDVDNDGLYRESPPDDELVEAGAYGATFVAAMRRTVTKLALVIGEKRGHVPDPGLAMEDAIETASDGGEL